MAIGATFSPATDRRDPAGRSMEPVQVPQGSIKTINYSLPKFSAHAPSPLVSQSQVGSPFSSAVLASVFKTVLGSGQDAGFASSSSPSPIAAPSRDTGISDYAAANIPQPQAPHVPQTRPTAPPNGSGTQPTTPQFQGIVDTPPAPQAPVPSAPTGPVFDPQPDYSNAYGGNAWQALGADDSEERRRYLDLVAQFYAQAQARGQGNGPGAGIQDNAQNGAPQTGRNA